MFILLSGKSNGTCENAKKNYQRLSFLYLLVQRAGRVNTNTNYK